MFLLDTFEIAGTVAFAISGALIGIRKELDIFGVIFLAITTAVGGGIFRDVFLGKTPPMAFVKPIYCLISILSALLTFIFHKKILKLKNIILIFDAIGLGAFTVIGSTTAMIGNMDKPFLVICMGLLTGIGGGILRDVFVKDIPLVFQREIYAIASVLGSTSLYYTYNNFKSISSLYMCFIITFAIRMIAVKYNLNLPVLKSGIHLEEHKACETEA
ncbi:trimeric intracellular cation channel family protein [Irregularibacter muris]|uniref:Trimeric intracellular cation channel family protein n=1 Tax=Irregularibacter muris TaxID=1796619 RepID=A0AAE3HCH4_9FIRM|nr:trimeric intracellular cation channel family protein [Irregularibacter muris]MCR1897550.1 trimeric intracellular cation channel family protein [Irregularibacter muris]